jgi:uncharacterized protein YrzB (UPF0473 family)
MGDKRILKLTDINGIVTEYEVIMTFPWHNKSYLVYTDNTYDEEGRLNILAAIYKSDKELDPIETDEEWNEIDRRLKELEQR